LDKKENFIGKFGKIKNDVFLKKLFLIKNNIGQKG